MFAVEFTSSESNATVTTPLASLIAAYGETAPFSTPRIDGSVSRRFAFALIPNRVGSFFMSTCRSAATVTRKVPAFLSLSNRFFVNTPGKAPSAARCSSTVGTATCA